MKDYLEKRRAELKKRGNKGFTLMEMLIVVAIIAVLIAIAIPIFTSQLENSREATDAANLRSAYATASAAMLTNGGKSEVSAGPVNKQQAQEDWQNTSLTTNNKIGTLDFNNSNVPTSSAPWYVHVDPDGKVTINNTKAATNVDPVSGKSA